MNNQFLSAPKPLLIFYGLVFYVFLQFSWWSYLLYELNDQVIYLNAQLELTQGIAPDQESMVRLLSQKRLMILGEGLVFLILLTLGIMQTRKSFKRESILAMQQHNFLLSVTHELKTPVASLKLFLQTIHKRELPREKQMELTAKALEESNRLDHLIENILLLNRMDSPAFSLQMENHDLSELANDVVERFKLSHLPEGMELILEVEKMVIATTDEQALRSILGNLLENAVKYAHSGRSIRVGVESDRMEAILRVSDLGPGIPEEEKHRVFNRFYRSGREETRNTKGTGLGLFITKNLVDAMGGKIILKDNLPSGCIFEVRFKRTT